MNDQPKKCENVGNSDVLELTEPEIGGGRISIEKIDTIQDSQYTKIKISGLNQKTFDYFIDTYGYRFSEIHFWKCPHVKDLSKLEILTDIKSISYYWNQKAESLWDLSKNIKLKKFSFGSFRKVHDLSELSLSPSLEELEIENVFWIKCILESLEPLSAIKSLKRLEFYAKKIIDDKIEPLSRTNNLCELDFGSRLFSTEKLAWLKSRMPNDLKSQTLAPYQRTTWAYEHVNKMIDTYINGKRKPSLDWNVDRNRIEKYVKAFNDLVNYYAQNKQLPEPE